MQTYKTSKFNTISYLILSAILIGAFFFAYTQLNTVIAWIIPIATLLTINSLWLYNRKLITLHEDHINYRNGCLAKEKSINYNSIKSIDTSRNSTFAKIEVLDNNKIEKHTVGLANLSKSDRYKIIIFLRKKVDCTILA